MTLSTTLPLDERIDRADRGFGRMLRVLIITAPVVVFLLVLAIVGVGLTSVLRQQAERTARSDLGALGEQIQKRISDVAQVARSVRDSQIRLGVPSGAAGTSTFIRRPESETLEVLRTLLEAQAKINPHADPEAAHNNTVQGVYIAYQDGDRPSNPWYDWHFKGKQNSGYDFRRPDTPGNGWYLGVKDLNPDEFGVTGPYFDTGGARMWLVSVTLPVRVGGRFVGVAGADFWAEGLGETIRAVIRRSEDTEETGYAFLVGTPNGATSEPVVFAATQPLEQIASRPDRIGANEKSGQVLPPVTDFPLGHQIAQEPTGYLQEFTDQAGHRQLISWAELAVDGARSMHWKIVRTVPHAAVWGTYDYVRRLCLLGALPSLLVILGLAFWLAERALGPIPTLAATAATVEQGKYNAEGLAGVAHRRDEMGQLARGFRKMVGVLADRDADLRRSQEELRHLADDLRHERDSLEGRVRARTAELEQTNDELLAAKEATEQAMKQKDVFLDTVAHDLRMPLAVVIGYSKDLREQAIEEGLTDFVADLGKVIDRSEDLLDLVKDLLQISKARIGGGVELVLDRFEIGPMLRTRLDAADWVAKNTGNTITARIDEGVGAMVADKVKLWRILMNLLTNACKFTPRGGRIEVAAARMTEGGRDWVVFRVADTGKGMTAEQQSRLFKRFSQIPGTAAEHRDGFGLGLSICLLYCRAMGGRISVESVEGSGSVFTVTLPAVVEPISNPAAPSGHRPPADAAQRSGGVRSIPALPSSGREETPSEEKLILIIDDDPLIVELMRRNLNEGGFQTRSASDGIEGLRLARELKPSAVVLDVLMPVIDGWAVLAALKSDPATAQVPVIMASVLDERQRGLTMGADDYVSKPVQREILAQLLHKHLDGHEAGRLLVVEDDAETRSRLCRLLRQQGWEVAEAGDGVEALTLMRRERPDLILLDLFLPTLDGFGVVDVMLQDPHLSLIPIVVLTAGILETEARSRLGGQVEQVLQKGNYDRRELLRTVRSLVRESHRRLPPLARENHNG